MMMTLSEGFKTLKDAEKRKKEIEYKQSVGTFVVPKCTKVKELIKEYIRIYGHNEWGLWTYSGRGPQKECPVYGKEFYL